MTKNKEQALYEFWSSFGIPAMEENSVPTDLEAKKAMFDKLGITYPYITYEVKTSDWPNRAFLTGTIWDRSSSWTYLNNKADEISKYIGRGGVFIDCSDGGIQIQKSDNWSFNDGDPADDMVKRKVLNISVDFITSY